MKKMGGAMGRGWTPGGRTCVSSGKAGRAGRDRRDHGTRQRTRGRPWWSRVVNYEELPRRRDYRLGCSKAGRTATCIRKPRGNVIYGTGTSATTAAVKDAFGKAANLWLTLWN